MTIKTIENIIRRLLDEQGYPVTDVSVANVWDCVVTPQDGHSLDEWSLTIVDAIAIAFRQECIGV